MEQNQGRGLVLAQIFFIFVLPPALLGLGILPPEWRMLVLCVVILFMLGVIQHERISDSTLGLSRIAFKKTIIPYLLFTLLGVGALWQLARVIPHSSIGHWWQNPHLLFLFLPVSLLQEVSYRGFLFPKLRILFPESWLLVITNALLFTLIHVIYPLPGVILPLSFIAGIAFAWMYKRFPSLLGIILAHAILNFTAVFHGFFYFGS